jgi:cysteine synthase A
MSSNSPLALGLRRESVAALLAAAVAVALALRWVSLPSAKARDDESADTPLLHLKHLSAATGCTILGKAEFLQPAGGSCKDRLAARVIADAMRDGSLRAGGVLFEGTSGSTGISLAALAPRAGFRVHIVCVDDASPDKVQVLRELGAAVTLVPPVGITNPSHYVNVARRLAAEENAAHGPTAALFVDQFENPANAAVHRGTTGPEIARQVEALTGGLPHAFVAGAGTGGTLAGVGAYFAERRSRLLRSLIPGSLASRRTQLFLVDPPGSSLRSAVVYGVAYAPQQAERTLRRNRRDTLIEGVGLDRLCGNFKAALPLLDGAFSCTDAEAVAMAHYLRAHEGLWLGSSSAMNVVGAVKAARVLGPGHVIVTILCDHGSRHAARFWNEDVLAQSGLGGVALPAAGDVSFVVAVSTGIPPSGGV